MKLKRNQDLNIFVRKIWLKRQAALCHCAQRYLSCWQRTVTTCPLLLLPYLISFCTGCEAWMASLLESDSAQHNKAMHACMHARKVNSSEGNYNKIEVGANLRKHVRNFTQRLYCLLSDVLRMFCRGRSEQRASSGHQPLVAGFCFVFYHKMWMWVLKKSPANT